MKYKELTYISVLEEKGTDRYLYIHGKSVRSIRYKNSRSQVRNCVKYLLQFVHI